MGKPKKAMAKKAKAVKKVTKKMQTGSMRQVWNGTKVYTKGGLMKKDLMLNKRNKVVSKKAHKVPAKGLKSWNSAIMKARAELNIPGFCTINRGEQGIALYKLAKNIHGS